MLRKLYFAFGSNMLFERLARRVVEEDVRKRGKRRPDFGSWTLTPDNSKAKLIKAGTYTLPNYELVFDCGGSYGTYANIQKRQGGFVEGVLYELTEQQEADLDRYENWPVNYEKQYFMLPSGDLGFAYVSVNPYFKAAKDDIPDRNYLDILIEGAAENNLWATYNKLVDYRGKHYVLPKGNKYKKVINKK
jgi:hypothetical protein